MDTRIEHVRSRPKDERGLWLWITLVDGSAFEAVWRRTNLLDFPATGPVMVELRQDFSAGQTRPRRLVQRQEIASIEVLGVMGGYAAVRRRA